MAAPGVEGLARGGERPLVVRDALPQVEHGEGIPLARKGEAVEKQVQKPVLAVPADALGMGKGVQIQLRHDAKPAAVRGEGADIAAVREDDEVGIDVDVVRRVAIPAREREALRGAQAVEVDDQQLGIMAIAVADGV